jgi:D-alanine-D-alanine ligase-like ATP-grasp enzyme
MTTVLLIESLSDKPWRSEDTYGIIEASLAERWRTIAVRPRTEAELREQVSRAGETGRGSLFVFNIAEYLDEPAKEGFIPGILDELGVPRLGSSAAAARLALDKAGTKRRLEALNLPSPRFIVAEGGDSAARARAAGLRFPLFVKPALEGGHIGIGEDSIVRGGAELDAAVERVLRLHRQAALVEEYVGGEGMREFSVGVLDGRARRFLPIEIDWAAMGLATPILSHDAAIKDLERIKPVEGEAARNAVLGLAGGTFDAIGALDYARIDIRSDARGYFVLEINALPGLGPRSFLPEAAESLLGLGYPDLIRTLAEESMARQGISGA